MSKAQEGLKDLKTTAESTLFADWHVTPELKAKLRRRIRQAEAQANERRRPVLERGLRPVLPMNFGPVAVAAVSAAAVLLVGTAGLMLPAPEEVASTASQAQAPSPAVLPPPIAPGQVAAAPTAETVRLKVSPVQVVTSATLKDQYGNAVSVGSSGHAVFTSTTTESLATPGAGQAGVEAVPGQKLVLNADFQLQTADAATAMTELQRLALARGGYVVESTLARGNDGSYAGRVVMRVPSSAYADAILQMDRFGKVAQQRQWSQDVTDRYQDLTVRIKLLQEMEQKLAELALKAATFDDWLKLTQQINENRAQLESLQGSLKQLANQVEYSTITVTLHQPAPDAVQPVAGTQPPGLGRAMSEAFAATIRKAGSLGRRSLIGLAGLAPVLAVAALLGGATYGVWRRRRSGKAGSEEQVD